MGKLTDLLKMGGTTPVQDKKDISALNEKKVSVSTSPKTEDLDFHISSEDLEKIRKSVVEINTTNKSRVEIVVGMYGDIRDPQTGNRFVIPNLDFSTENYIYEYAETMRTLVNRPEDFKKIMNWE